MPWLDFIGFATRFFFQAGSYAHTAVARWSYRAKPVEIQHLQALDQILRALGVDQPVISYPWDNDEAKKLLDLANTSKERLEIATMPDFEKEAYRRKLAEFSAIPDQETF